MTETVEPAAPDAPESETEEQKEPRSITEQLEQLAREIGVLALREAQLETARNAADVRRAVRDLAGSIVMAVAFLAAFAFVNVAALSGLAKAMPSWLAALVLAAVWAAIGGSLLVVFTGRVRRWRLWGVFTARPAEAVAELEQARDDAGDAVQATLGRLGPAITIEVASAAVPLATGMASGVIDSGDALLEASDDIVESLTEDLPGGSVVNQIWDVALMPGRFGVRVATTVLKREPPPD